MITSLTTNGAAPAEGLLKLGDEAGRLAALHRYETLDTPPEPAFDEITAIVRSVFAAPMAAISLVDAQRQWFKSKQGIGVDETPRDVAFCDHTIKGGSCMAVEDAARDPRFALNPMVTGEPRIRSYLGAPLTSPDGYNIGSLCVIDAAPRVFTEAEAALLRRFAALVVTQFELRQIASRDCLTGALSRRALEEVANRELARCKRHGADASLAVFDLDRFKAVNDTYGHGVGDAVLAATVTACLEVLRDTDCLGRIGGEEFGVVIVGATPIDAMRSMERMRAAIAAARLPGLPDLRFTASFGAAACAPTFTSATQWFAAADARLYAAKRAGRDRCMIATSGH